MEKSNNHLTAKPTDVVSLRLRRWHFILIVLSLAALVFGSVMLGMLLAPQSGIDRDAVEYPWTPPGGVGASGEISLPGYEKITFPANTQKVDLVLPNPTGNPCNFRFTIMLSDTDEVLYQSGLIPPGMAVTEITLARALEVGNYALSISIETTAIDDGAPMNGAVMQVDLEVK